MRTAIHRLSSAKFAAVCAVLAASWFGIGSATILGAQASPLISVAELQKIKNDPSLVLLQMGPKEDYEKGHIEGARLVGQNDIAMMDSVHKLALELPSEADLRAGLERFGISDKSRIVVVFGADWVTPGARVLWTLQVAGLGAQSQYLDGGTVAWKKAGLPLVTTEPAPAKPGKLTVAQNRALVVDYAWIQAHANAPHVRIVDGRAPMFYDGPGMKHEGQPDMKGSHIPGAVNIPFNSLNDDGNQVLPTDKLRALFTKAGVQPGDTVAAYCHIGQQGTFVLLAARLLGHPIRLYDGSMNDWENRKLPTVSEKAPGK